MAIEELGPELDPESLAGLDVPEPEIQAGEIRCEVVEFNRFGNVKLNVRQAHLAAAGIEENPDLAVEAVSGSTRARRGKTYADFAAGEYGLIFDPRGWLMVVRGNPASALEGLGLAPGDPVWISGPASRSEVVTP
jgi:S-adenosylmethionine hydrolase